MEAGDAVKDGDMHHIFCLHRRKFEHSNYDNSGRMDFCWLTFGYGGRFDRAYRCLVADTALDTGVFFLGIAILVALNGLKGGAWMSGGGFASADFALLTICVLIGYFLAVLVTWLIRFLLPLKI